MRLRIILFFDSFASFFSITFSFFFFRSVIFMDALNHMHLTFIVIIREYCVLVYKWLWFTDWFRFTHKHYSKCESFCFKWTHSNGRNLNIFKKKTLIWKEKLTFVLLSNGCSKFEYLVLLPVFFFGWGNCIAFTQNDNSPRLICKSKHKQQSYQFPYSSFMALFPWKKKNILNFR